MKIDSALHHAIAGIHSGLGSARQHAAEVAGSGQLQGGSADGLAAPMVGLIQDRLQVSASTQVLKAVDDMIGSLFDARA